MKKVGYICTLILIATIYSCGVSENTADSQSADTNIKSNVANKYNADKEWMEESKKDFDYFLSWYEEKGNTVASRDHEIIGVSKNRNKKYLNKKRRLEAGVDEAYTLNFEYEGNWKSPTQKDQVEFVYTFNDDDSIINKTMVTKNSYDIPIFSKMKTDVPQTIKTAPINESPTVVTQNISQNTSQNISQNVVESKPKKIVERNTTVHGIYPQASTRILTISDLIAVSVPDLKIMRNEIFARHGHSFRNGGAMDKYFTSKSWYQNKKLDATPLLTEVEKKNIKLILALERE